MASSLPITDEPTLEHPVTLPPTPGPLETRDNAPFDEERWDAWVAKGPAHARGHRASTERHPRHKCRSPRQVLMQRAWRSGHSDTVTLKAIDDSRDS